MPQWPRRPTTCEPASFFSRQPCGPPTPMYRTPKMSDDWDKQAEFMRRHGAVSATWVIDHGYPECLRLTSLTLGPAPTPPKTQPERHSDDPTPPVRRHIGSAPGLTRKARVVGRE